jgi:predicted nucleic acid-binding Zn ribbon protein
MIRVFDFRCEEDHVAEHFLNTPITDDTEIPCAVCGKPSKRQLAAPRAQLDGCSGHFPGAADAWERRRESHMRKEQKNVAEHGTYD